MRREAGMAQFSLREATEEDLREVLRVENAVHVAPWTGEGFREELQKPYSHVLVMTDDETDSVLAGYIVFWILLEETQILNVAVDLQHRRQGHAQRMIRKVVDLALKAGSKRLLLDVRKSNLPAIELYQKLGFTIKQVRKRFYSNGEDAYGMALDLTAQKLFEF